MPPQRHQSYFLISKSYLLIPTSQSLPRNNPYPATIPPPQNPPEPPPRQSLWIAALLSFLGLPNLIGLIGLID